MVLDFDNQIEILLNEQEKIVSYKEINNRFDLTPSESQELLSKFVEKKRKDDPSCKFYVTYLIIGTNHQTKVNFVLDSFSQFKPNQIKCKQINLINEADLDLVEKDCVIDSKKVYSIQNFKIEDFNILYSNDVDSSNNTTRKANLSVKFGEKIPNNLMEQATVMIKNEPLVERVKPKPVETAKKPSSDLSKHKEDVSNQKENIKGSVKEEPMDTSESTGKKTKFGGETKQKSLPKPAAKQPAKHQSTLTNFFKKA